MRNATDVIAQVVSGKGPELARILEVSESRCYEILSRDSPYPKTKRLIRAIAQVNLQGIRIIKADMDSMFADILGESSETTSAIDLHREAFEAVQAVLEHKSDGDRAKELRELISVAQCMLREINAEDELTPREIAERRTKNKFSVIGGR